MFNWNDMDTAPKDGEKIFLRFGSRQDSNFCVGYWSVNFDKFVDDLNGDCLVYAFCQPTGWLSLRNA